MVEGKTPKMICKECGYEGLTDGFDGFFYCDQCGAQADDIMDTGVADEDFVDMGGNTRGAIYQASHKRQRPSEPLTQSQPLIFSVEDTQHSLFWSQFESCVPSDFGSVTATATSEDYYTEVRKRYVMGLQMMIQYQCEALVKEFNVTPLICGLVGPIWLRFVALSGVFDDDWGEAAIKVSEVKPEETREDKRRTRYGLEPHNLYGKRAVLIWVKSLRMSLPLSSSLVICFLACHIARASVLPTDIVRWAFDGKLPYLSCFVKIRNEMGERSPACPITVTTMFKPSRIISPQRLETRAAFIAEEIGLNLPPVNFYSIASNYLKQLSLPIEKILPEACRIQNWSTPPDLYLSKNDSRLPTRVCVMAVLIVTIRILYNINGFGVWEKSLGIDSVTEMDDDDDDDDGDDEGDDEGDDDEIDSETKSNTKSSTFGKDNEFNTKELLKNLEEKYHEIALSYDHEKGLLDYIQHGKHVVFAGSEESSSDNVYKTIEELWNQYLNEKDVKQIESNGNEYETPTKRKRCQDDGLSLLQLSLEEHDQSISRVLLFDQERASTPQTRSFPKKVRENAIRKLKADMEENVFCYISPRVKLKRLDYLHYVRRKEKGALIYAAHADYYILLRVCAKIAEVDTRILHLGVLSFERRLAWLEKRTEYCLGLTPLSMACKYCSSHARNDDADDDDNTYDDDMMPSQFQL